jgi:branched-chain amino acid transport system permease protein
MSLFLTQVLNGLQAGVLLFLLAAGLTLVFGIMNFVNLSHGSFYMFGAYIAAFVYDQWGSFLLAAAMAIGVTLVLGLVANHLIFRSLSSRDHLYQVLGTFGLILIFNELVQVIWGSAPLYTGLPDVLGGAVPIFGALYPIYRLVIIGVGLLMALGLYLLIHRTRAGMLIRAGAYDARMASALGINIWMLNALIFGLGAALAGLAGFMAGPLVSVQSGMGESVLILTLVVIVTGGIGSIYGAFFGALLVGLVDTLGRAFIPQLLGLFLRPEFAQAAGTAIASMLIYMLMAVVLALRPAGLFPARHA